MTTQRASGAFSWSFAGLMVMAPVALACGVSLCAASLFRTPQAGQAVQVLRPAEPLLVAQAAPPATPASAPVPGLEAAPEVAAGPSSGNGLRLRIDPVPATAAAPLVAAAHGNPELRYYDGLRSNLRWVSSRMGKREVMTLDVPSRLMLAKSAAQRAGLHEVGLGFADVYGIINAETSWVPRLGASKDGTPNLGIAQFEPETARLLGVRNPNDPVEAIHAAALHMKEAAVWSASRISRLNLGHASRAEKLREGVSIYYNLSSRGRATWNGSNTRRLPVETRQHISNARIGAQQAELFEARLRTRG